MPEPKTEPQEEPRRTSQPNPAPQPMTPMEPPATPGTEYEKQIPHQGNQPIAREGTIGKSKRASDEEERVSTPSVA